MLKALFLAVLMMAGTSHAQTKREAQEAGLADVATTIAAIAAGAVEGNPLGLASLLLKIPVLKYIDTLPEEDKPEAWAIQESVWEGAAVNNVCIVAAILTGGSFAPACFALGAGWAYKEWKGSAQEREFWQMCREHRIHANKQLTCTYIRKEQAPAA